MTRLTQMDLVFNIKPPEVLVHFVETSYTLRWFWASSRPLQVMTAAHCARMGDYALIRSFLIELPVPGPPSRFLHGLPPLSEALGQATRSRGVEGLRIM